MLTAQLKTMLPAEVLKRLLFYKLDIPKKKRYPVRMKTFEIVFPVQLKKTMVFTVEGENQDDALKKFYANDPSIMELAELDEWPMGDQKSISEVVRKPLQSLLKKVAETPLPQEEPKASKSKH